MDREIPKAITGSYLNDFWCIGAEHALYHKDTPDVSYDERNA
ncbi:hypothetical protein ACP8Y2_00740 [Herpetosiphon llansteffanensis]